MEVKQLRVHEKVVQILYQNLNQNAFRIDDEGYEYLDEEYTNLYDGLVSRIWAIESLIWI